MRRVTLMLTAALFLATPVARSQQVELEFLTISLAGVFDDYINDLVARYEAENPEVRIRWVDQPLEAVQQRLLASLAAGNPADVVNLNIPTLLSVAELGAIAPMNDLVSDDERDLYFEGLYESFSLDGEQYGLPWYIAPAVVAYNSELFEQAGLDPDDPPTTLESMIEAAVQIKDETGVYGFMPNVNAQNMLYRFLEAGLPVLNEFQDEALFNSPEHVALLERFIELFQNDYFPEDTMRRGYIGAVELYTSGQLGMLITGPQFLLRVRNDNPDIYDLTRVAPYPLDEGEIIHAPLMGLSVPRGVAHPEEAMRFALFVTNDENQLAFSKETVIFPSTTQAAQDPYFTELPEDPSPEDLARQIDAEQLEYAADLTAELTVPNASDLFENFKNNIEAAFFGQKSAQDALDDAVAFWNSRL